MYWAINVAPFKTYCKAASYFRYSLILTCDLISMQFQAKMMIYQYFKKYDQKITEFSVLLDYMCHL